MKKEMIITLAALCVAVAALTITVTRSPAPPHTGHEDDITRTLLQVQRNLARLSNAYATLAAHVSTDTPSPRFTQAAPPPDASMNVDSLSGTVSMMDNSLAHLKSIVDSTGLEQVATNREYHPALLQEMLQEHAREKMVDMTRDQLRQVHEVHMASDKDEYGPDVAELYEKARSRRRGNNEEREQAFTELVESYPHAYATGMVIAERAIGQGFRGNTDDVEEYYSQLQSHDKFDQVVTEWGVEAVPAVQNYLAEKYIEDGRYDDARNIIEEMKESYPDSLVFRIGRHSRGERFQTATEIIGRLEDTLGE